jgi:ABC-2 type transport system ATP-binding protein
MSDTVISLTNLTKAYGMHRGIDDVGFTVKQGEIFGFIGPNGAGKTTTIRIMMGLLKPDAGKAAIFGMDCNREAAVIAKSVGYLPSENSYYNTLRVKDMLEYTADLYGKECGKRIKELSGLLNLDLSKKIKELSLGNKKKVGIVSALITEPQLLILDEPTSGLDPLMQQTFYNILSEENRKRGMTIFFSSHVLTEVQRLCNRVAILKEGRLLGIQSMKELRGNGYKKVTLMAKDTVPEGLFATAGIKNYVENQAGNSVSFMYSGEVVNLIEKLRMIPLEDVFIEEPSLEEIFMHYYE